jgi:HAD superfamily hydrolase (TIGR01490 family)
MAVAFFDLDRTILDCNSGRLWLAREWREGRIGLRDAAWGAWWIAAYSVGYGSIEEVYDQAVATLAGTTEADIEARTERWFAEEVRDRIRPGAATVLEQHRARGDTLVLATSSSIYAGRAAARAYGLEHVIAATFQVDAKGVFTGAVDEPAAGRHKAERAARWASERGVDLAESTFYTDSYADIDLMRLVGRPVAVHPDPRLRREAQSCGWTIADWSTPEGS